MNKYLNKLITAILLAVLTSTSITLLSKFKEKESATVNLVTLNKKFPVDTYRGTSQYVVRLTDEYDQVFIKDISSVMYLEMEEGRKYLVTDSMVDKDRGQAVLAYMLIVVFMLISIFWSALFLLVDVVFSKCNDCESPFTIKILKEQHDTRTR